MENMREEEDPLFTLNPKVYISILELSFPQSLRVGVIIFSESFMHMLWKVSLSEQICSTPIESIQLG